MQKIIPVATIAGLIAFIAIPVDTTFAEPIPMGTLFYDGETVRTVVPPTPIQRGLDDLYLVTDQDQPSEQLPITSVAPGDRDYHGGMWTVNLVTFDEMVEPYLLDSEQAVLDALDAGHISIQEDVDAFLCPVQP